MPLMLKFGKALGHQAFVLCDLRVTQVGRQFQYDADSIRRLKNRGHDDMSDCLKSRTGASGNEL